jgi:hypothetical protein
MKGEMLQINSFAGESKLSPEKLPDGIHQTISNWNIRDGNLVKGEGHNPVNLNGVPFTKTGISELGGLIRFENNSSYMCVDSGAWPKTLCRWDDVSAWDTIGEIDKPDNTKLYDRGQELLVACRDKTPYLFGTVEEHFKYVWVCDGTTDTETTIPEEDMVYPAYIDHDLVVSDIDTTYSHLFTWNNSIPAGAGERAYKIAIQNNDGSFWLSSAYASKVASDMVSYGRNTMTITLDPAVYPTVNKVLLFATEPLTSNSYFLVKEIDVNRNVPQITNWLEKHVAYYDNVTGYIYVDPPADGLTVEAILAGEYDDFVLRVYESGTDTLLGVHVINECFDLGIFDIGLGFSYSGALDIDIIEAWRLVGTNYEIRVMDEIGDLTSLPSMTFKLGYDIPLYTPGHEYSTETQADKFTNYAHCAIGFARMFVANVVRNGVTYLQRVYYSHIDTNGVSRYDTFLDNNYIDLSGYTVGNIMGIMYNQQKLYIFCSKGILILSLNAGGILSWRLDKIVSTVGVVAENSITRITDGRYSGGFMYMANDGIRALYNGYSYNISQDINPIVVTNNTEAVGFYSAALQMMCMSFLWDRKIFMYSLTSDKWTSKEAVNVVATYTGDNEELLMYDGNSLWKFGNSNMFNNLNGVKPVFKSKRFVFDSHVRVKRIIMRYKSDTPLWVIITLDSATVQTLTIPASTTWTVLNRKLKAYNWTDGLELRIELFPSDYTINTVAEISYIDLEVMLRSVYD